MMRMLLRGAALLMFGMGAPAFAEEPASPSTSGPGTAAPSAQEIAQAADAQPSEKAPPLPRIPSERVSYEAIVGARVNPLGFEVGTMLAHRHRLYASESLALRDNDVGIGLSPTVSPGVFRTGGFVEFRPLTLLNLQGHIHHVGYPGSFNAVARFRSAEEDFSDDAIKRLGEAKKTHPTSGLEVQARAVALAKVGPIVVRDDLGFTYTSLDLEDDEPLYYNQRPDLLLQNQGWFVTNDTDVVFMSTFGLIAGARLTVAHTFISDELLGGEAGEDALTTVRLGPIVAFTFFDEPGAAFNKPTLVAFAQWWLMHPYRTGEASSQALPLIAAAFRIEGDLFRAPN